MNPGGSDGRSRAMIKGEPIRKIESNLYYVDSRYLGSWAVSGVYLLVGDGLTLIETGTSLVGPRILEIVGRMGYGERDIRRAIVTHVHLDHAGAAGWLARRLPHVRIYVHERGARHLMDPAQLIKSAEMVYGSLENVLALHGEILPVPEENLVAVSEANLDVGGGVSLKVFPSPGHAPHHLCLFDRETGCLFSGEGLGHYYPESDLLIPAVAPPGFNLETCKETAKRIREFRPRTICFSQFGHHRDPDFVIEESIRQLDSCQTLMKTYLGKGLSRNEIIERMLRAFVRQRKDREPLRGMFTSLVLGFETYYARNQHLSKGP